MAEKNNGLVDVPTLAAAFDAMGSGMREMGLACATAARAFREVQAITDPMRVTNPGEWPDEFALLNRYLRTGVKPPFIFND